ncbi:unnamed protein product, partial [Heterotrigona itama]
FNDCCHSSGDGSADVAARYPVLIAIIKYKRYKTQLHSVETPIAEAKISMYVLGGVPITLTGSKAPRTAESNGSQSVGSKDCTLTRNG